MYMYIPSFLHPFIFLTHSLTHSFVRSFVRSFFQLQFWPVFLNFRQHNFTKLSLRVSFPPSPSPSPVFEGSYPQSPSACPLAVIFHDTHHMRRLFPGYTKLKALFSRVPGFDQNKVWNLDDANFLTGSGICPLLWGRNSTQSQRAYFLISNRAPILLQNPESRASIKGNPGSRKNHCGPSIQDEDDKRSERSVCHKKGKEP